MASSTKTDLNTYEPILCGQFSPLLTGLDIGLQTVEIFANTIVDRVLLIEVGLQCPLCLP